MDELDKFFIDLLDMMKLAPTEWRVGVLKEWARNESTALYEQAFNPLATTWYTDDTPLSIKNIGYGPGNWNSVPVRIYASHETGVLATFKTLSLDYYFNIRNCLKDQTGYVAAISDFKTWVGSEAYGRNMVNFMNNSSASKTDLFDKKISATSSPITELNEALMKRFAIMGYASRLTLGALGDYDEMLKLYDQLKSQF